MRRHEDLVVNYGVSCPELDFIVREAVRLGAYGARLTGAGFGGSAVILASKSRAKSVAEGVLGRYVREFPWSPKYFVVEASDGAASRGRHSLAVNVISYISRKFLVVLLCG